MTIASPYPRYRQPLYRPPSEASSLIYQITFGCSHNRCLFCTMYKGKSFAPRPQEEVLEEIRRTAPHFGDTRRVFLADGDACVLPAAELLTVLGELYRLLPALERVTAYATPGNIVRKTEAELRALREAGLNMIYLGFESGSDFILKKIKKGALRNQHAEAVAKAREAGIAISATAILGLGGREYSREHAEGTAALVNSQPPDYLSLLSLLLEPESEREMKEAFGPGWQPLSDRETLEEIETLLGALQPERPVIFRANHASNALALKGTLPQDLPELREMVRKAREGEIAVRPEWMRGL